MFRALSNPKLFLTLLGFVEWMNHLGGNERVIVAVDKEHGVWTLPDLFDGRGLTEAPAVLNLAE